MRFSRFAVMVVGMVFPLHADEGMWLFSKPPVEQVKERHDFEITPEWLEHLRKSSVRFGGGSGSFVSPDGLILTNHHVGAGTIERLSTTEKDYLKDGFYAENLEDELPCPGMELNVLMSITDVTERVNAAVEDDLTADEAVAARREVIAEIEREAGKESGLNCEVVAMYRGGQYHLYQFQRYSEVKLVFAPDARAAAFGGDPDNFEYPRYCLDFCFFRAYQDGKPAKTPHFLKWKEAGAEEGELTFVSGHPGRTNRSMTLAQMESMRDRQFPQGLERMYRVEALLRAWSDRDLENARRAKQSLVGTQNGRKASQARLDGLLDPEFMDRKRESEKALRGVMRADERWRAADEAHDEIARLLGEGAEISVRERMWEGGEAFGTRFFGMARTLVRVAEESGKPDGERLPEYQESGRDSLEHGLFSERPIHLDFETLWLGDSLTVMCGKLGVDDPLVKKVLDGKSPRERAVEWVQGTELGDVKVRRRLYEGGMKAIRESRDPLIRLALLVDGEARKWREKGDAISEGISQAHRKIAEARFAMEGDAVYPDANFTLRLSYGLVRGYPDPDGVAAFTTFQGMQERHEGQKGIAPFDLSDEWKEKAGAIDGGVRLNFVSDHDITGGNSGSPMVNRDGELVGLIFDSNAPGLVSDFGYNGGRGRAVSVHPAGMLAVMRSVYQTERLLKELGF
jgi:hypothetical protein